jgi:aspartyl-tRNA(Asn)/glutamyl-tRNA(Gln) amidotransferase subunit B
MSSIRTGNTHGKTSWETVIGLEVHVELCTRSKMFCACATAFGAPPNSQVCPVCLGLPGALPVPNRQAVEYAMRAALALGCEIAEDTRFDRKNYHYPDLPKGYQVSQYQRPLGVRGRLSVGGRSIGIRRLHMEEDTGKSTHEGLGAATGVDFNRCGVPLVEIVSEPDLRSPAEAAEYLRALRSLILYTGVSDVKMEEGSLRCDANISLRPAGSDGWGSLVEIKNMNSFRSVQRALEYEEARQRDLLESGGRVARETRHWDDRRGITFSSRSKEEAHDYRYFPEPDLVPLRVDRAWVEAVRASLPELPPARRARYAGLGLSEYDAGVLVDDPDLAAYFDRLLQAGAEPRTAASWLTTELLGRLNARGEPLSAASGRVPPEALAKLLGLIAAGTISGKIAKEVLDEQVEKGGDPEAIVRSRGLVQISDAGELARVVAGVVAANPASVADYRAGKEKALGFLVGQVMKATRGKANPAVVNDLLRRELG